jgi:hypothetical protein
MARDENQDPSINGRRKMRVRVFSERLDYRDALHGQIPTRTNVPVTWFMRHTRWVTGGEAWQQGQRNSEHGRHGKYGKYGKCGKYGKYGKYGKCGRHGSLR